MSSHSLRIEPTCQLKQNQQMHLSLQMQQALLVLQLPLQELAEWLSLEIEKNPTLELDLSHDPFKEPLEAVCSVEYNEEPLFETSDSTVLAEEKKRKAYRENLLTYPLSFKEYLREQVPWNFEAPEERAIAEQCIEHLDENGFLPLPPQKLFPHVSQEHLTSILKTLQSFDPPGVFARNLQESLLIQLRQKGKEKGPLFCIIAHHFEDLLANRIPQISKTLKLSAEQIQKMIDEGIAHLNFHPGHLFCIEPSPSVIPDITIEQKEGAWEIYVHHTGLPHFYASSICHNKNWNPEEKRYIDRHLHAAEWLSSMVHRRKDILLSIGRFLIETQSPFLTGEQNRLQPITLQQMAEALQLHESTVTRAVAHKYLFCAQGLFPLKSFFTQGIFCHDGQNISKHTFRRLLKQMIDHEDKRSPFSDAQLALQFKEKGIPCARRTITKYRQKMHIASATQRRRWHPTP